MSLQTDYEKGLLNNKLPKEISNKIERTKCAICGKKADYWIFPKEETIDLFAYQVGYQGLNHIVCQRCFKFKCFFDKITFRIMKIIFKLVKI